MAGKAGRSGGASPTRKPSPMTTRPLRANAIHKAVQDAATDVT